MEIVKDIEQGSPEWLELRCGVVTASRFKDVMAGGAGKTRKAYMLELAAELLTDEPQESYSNAYMEWGTQTEPQARSMYEFISGNDVEQVAFIKGKQGVGVSPDGLVGDSGLVEIKCPKTTTQISTYLGGSMPSSHLPQVQGQLWVADREWCDFVSFDPRINGVASYFCVRVHRDDNYIKTLEGAVDNFIFELNETVKVLRGE